MYQNVPALRKPLLAYDQNHGLDLPGAQFDGLTEQWFETIGDFLGTLEVPEQSELVEPDVAYFLDPAGIQFILSGPPTVVIS
jgi:hypothetical protein